MRIEAAWLREKPLADLLALLNANGEEGRVVGGAVRNELMKLPHGDIDVATTAEPKEVMRRANAAGFKTVPTGIDHGTVTVVIQSKPFEVTTLREDVETFGRHATVRFGRDWTRDAARRDFTMNGLSLSANGDVHDHVGGLADIETRRVRFIGDPATRIAEDYLRILRFFRFHAYYGHGAPDAAGLHAAIAGRGGLEALSRERVRMELMKLLVAPRALSALTAMADAGLLGMVIGGVPYLHSLERMMQAEAACGLAGDAVLRLGALAVWIAEDAERLRERLRLFNAEHATLAAMDHWWRVSPAADARALLYALGPEHYTARVMLAWSRARDDAGWREAATLPQRWSAPKFPVKAADFMARGIEKGPHLGAALARAEQAWVSAGFPMDEVELRRIVEEAAG